MCTLLLAEILNCSLSFIIRCINDSHCYKKATSTAIIGQQVVKITINQMYGSNSYHNLHVQAQRIASLIADKGQELPLFYHTVLVAMQTELFFTPLMYQVFSFPLSPPFYSFGLYIGKGPLNIFRLASSLNFILFYCICVKCIKLDI